MNQIPHNEVSERAVLACYLRDPALLESKQVPVEAFYLPQCKTIYRAMLSVAESGKLDAITLNNALHSRGDLEAVGGPVAVAELGSEVPTVGLFDHYADSLRALLKRRQMIAAAESISKEAFDLSNDLDKAVAYADAQVTALTIDSSERQAPTMRDLCKEALERYKRALEMPDGVFGVLTGFPALDKALGGMRAGEMTVLGARPAMGKTAFATQILLHAVQHGEPCGLFSGEMSADQITDRLVSQLSGVGMQKIRGIQPMSTHDLQAMQGALVALAKAPLYIDDRADLTIAQIRMKARQWKREHGIKLIAADYLQRFRASDPYQDRDERSRYMAVAEGFKSAAKELEVHSLVLAQLNRDAEDLLAKNIRQKHLEGCSRIEQEADMVMYLGRAGNLDQFTEEETETHKAIDVAFAKNRHGACPIVEMSFEKARVTFSEA